MENDYRYILEKGSKKFRCPACGKKTFVRYIDRQEDTYISEQYGRCDREINCGYFLDPYKDGYAKDDSDWRDIPTPKEKPTSYIDPKLFKASLKGYGRNIFVQYLKTIFDDETVKDLIGRYHIGSSKYWQGATVFWQVDESRKVRTGKIMLYQEDGHRKKSEDYNYINWVHAISEGTEFNLKQCLFGAHLIPGSDKPIAIVESEKTAIISSGYLPEYLWVATGALHNLKAETCKVLAGREVVLFPDLGAFDKWKEKATELAGMCDISVSNYLQTVASADDRQAGYDLADYLIQFDVDDFKQRDNASQSKFEKGYPDSWDEVTLDEGSTEYAEATRHAINDAAPDELKELCKRDPIVQKMIDLFDGEVTTADNLIYN